MNQGSQLSIPFQRLYLLFHLLPNIAIISIVRIVACDRGTIPICDTLRESGAWHRWICTKCVQQLGIHWEWRYLNQYHKLLSNRWYDSDLIDILRNTTKQGIWKGFRQQYICKTRQNCPRHLWIWILGKLDAVYRSFHWQGNLMKMMLWFYLLFLDLTSTYLVSMKMEMI